MTNSCAVCSALATNKYILHTGKLWTVSLASDQYFIGRTFVTLNMHKNSLSALDMDDWSELTQIINKYEGIVKQKFGADIFNWACLMNDAYKKQPYQLTHVHWHVRPRYSKPVVIDNLHFNDIEFGKHYRTRWDGREDYIIPEKIMKIIQAEISF